MPLVQGRELKRQAASVSAGLGKDAPRAEARIETPSTKTKQYITIDAPRAEAGIETGKLQSQSALAGGCPSRSGEN